MSKKGETMPSLTDIQIMLVGVVVGTALASVSCWLGPGKHLKRTQDELAATIYQLNKSQTFGWWFGKKKPTNENINTKR